jgi:hypothetical protein
MMCSALLLILVLFVSHCGYRAGRFAHIVLCQNLGYGNNRFRAAALSGKAIRVRPGLYSETGNTMLKEGDCRRRPCTVAFDLELQLDEMDQAEVDMTTAGLYRG